MTIRTFCFYSISYLGVNAKGFYVLLHLEPFTLLYDVQEFREFKNVHAL